MNYALKHLKKNKIIYSIILLFFFFKLLTFSYYKTIWWDSAVYIGMGKYIYSLGNSGLWEDSRPIVWPLMLGFFWKIKLNPIFSGRILEIIFGSFCILLTYMIGDKVFNRKAAVLSSLFLAFSPAFFFFVGIMLTEIVSTCFVLLGVYFIIKKRYFFSGIFFGLAFMSRFLQLLAFAAVFLLLSVYSRKTKTKNLIKLIAGFGMVIIPFLILNQFLYNNMLFPFLQQFLLSRNSGWGNFQPISFYFIELFRENIFYLIFVAGLVLAIRDKDINKKLIASVFVVFFIFFNSIEQKEMRFIIILIPYMCLLMSYLIIKIFDKLKDAKIKNILIALIILSLVLSGIDIISFYKTESNKKNQYQTLQNKFQNIDINNEVWVSNPVIPVLSNNKADKLIYYPYFSRENAESMIKNAGHADLIFLDSCDLACKLHDDKCEKTKTEFISALKQKLSIIYNSGADACEQFIFKK